MLGCNKLSSLLLTTALLACVTLQPVWADDDHRQSEGYHWQGHEGEGRSQGHREDQRSNEHEEHEHEEHEHEEHEHAEEHHSPVFGVAELVSALAWNEHGDIGHFHEHDYDHWREGHWSHGFHEGRNGWWWVLGGLWYYYPSPVYPYPDPYTPPTVVVESAPVAPVGVPPSSAYYCANPAGYYPYVARCYTAWQQVVTTGGQAAPVSQHEFDERELRALTREVEDIDMRSRHASQSLRSVEKQLQAFRKSLYRRDYNAMELLQETEELQSQIQDKREDMDRR